LPCPVLTACWNLTKYHYLPHYCSLSICRELPHQVVDEVGGTEEGMKTREKKRSVVGGSF